MATPASFFFLQVLINPEEDDLAHQVVRDRLVQREFYGTFPPFIPGQCLSEFLNPAWGGVEADVVSIGSEMDQVPAEVEGRHLVADLFHGIRSSLPDGRS